MTKNNLQMYFPLLRSREELLSEIHKREDLLTVYSGWSGCCLCCWDAASGFSLSCPSIPHGWPGRIPC